MVFMLLDGSAASMPMFASFCHDTESLVLAETRRASRVFEFSIFAYLKPRQVVGSCEHEREDRQIRLSVCGQRPRLG